MSRGPASPSLLLLLLLLTSSIVTTTMAIGTSSVAFTMNPGSSKRPWRCPWEEPAWCARIEHPEVCCYKKDPCSGQLISASCPITCRLCPVPCGGKKCQNFGSMNYENCTCWCQGHTGGPFCEDCVEADEDWCVGFLPKVWCGRSGGIDPLACPHYCGVCPDKCGGKQCAHHGTLNITTCTCTCRGLFTGPTCEVCPKADHVFCEGLDKASCEEIPKTFSMRQTHCPHLCGVCP